MAWNYGEGAGFYIDATTDKWKKHYRMYSYVSKEVSAACYAQHVYICTLKLSAFVRQISKLMLLMWFAHTMECSSKSNLHDCSYLGL